MYDNSEHKITILDSWQVYTECNIMVSSISLLSVALLSSFLGTGLMYQKCMTAIC